MRLVIALGGNALLRRGERPDASIQRRHVAEIAPALAAAARQHEVVIVHGNGPQVGMLALESEADPELSEPYPLSDVVAETQGLIGLWIQQEMVNAGSPPVATLVSQTTVDPDDPAFSAPTKFIGPVYDEPTATAARRQRGWSVKPDGSGWRRVVPSPRPLGVVELPTAASLLRAGTVVVLAGGGGVAVVGSDRGWRSIDAVVDKDYVAALCAQLLDADLLVILTDVPGVMTGFGTATERALGRVTVDELEELDLPDGSMGPKVEACCQFVRATGRRAAIGALDSLVAVIEGDSGTQVSLRAAVREEASP